MSQIELTKMVGYAWFQNDADRCTVSKLVAYLWLMPGDGGEDTSNRQGHVYSQTTRRLRS